MIDDLDEIEDLLKSEAEAETQFPSDKVWTNISKQLHKEKPWPALRFVALLIPFLFLIGTIYNYPPSNGLEAYKSFTLENKKTKPINKQIALSSSVNTHTKFATGSAPSKTSVKADLASQYKIIDNANDDDSWDIGFASDRLVNLQTYSFPKPKFSKERLIANIPQRTKIIPKRSDTDLTEELAYFGSIQTNKNFLTKWQFELYGTPSFSYRKLEEDPSLITTNGASGNAGSNNIINQKAGLGLEIGGGIRYNISKGIYLKAGLQFNIRKYFINAYKSVGTANLQIIQNNNVETISLSSAFGNSQTGENDIRLNNRLYQVSLPIGADFNFWEKDRVSIVGSASIQPTLALNKNIYILSTDYKYYANGESLFRKFNINSSLGISLNYKPSVGYLLYAGPQMRYQHLPTYSDKYPIKEYRLDYGIRMGIIKDF